jgi:hypothetical protein
MSAESGLRSCMRSIGLLLLLLWAAPLQAHSLDIVHFRVFPDAQEQNWRVEVILPSTLDPALPVEAAAGCSLLEQSRSSSAQGHVLEWQVVCAADAAEPALQTRWGRDGAIVELHAVQGTVATSMQPGSRLGARLMLAASELPQQSAGFAETAARYTWLGTTHVLIGWDHLAFVFCLAMLARGGALLWLISAFTLGHSISLAASFLGIVRIPIAPVEAVIALSVVFMAREAWLLQRQDQASSGQHGRLGLTAGFGLIHGLGFASVLGELGVSPGDTVTALAFFNIGVEIGQLLFVAAVLAAVAVLARLRWSVRAVQAALCLAGGMGLFWTLQRVATL